MSTSKDTTIPIVPKTLDLEFLQTITNLFHWSCWFGVVGSKRPLWRAWSLILLTLLIAIQVGAIWKVIKALAGWAIDTTGSRSVTARFSGTMFYSIAIVSLILSSRLASFWTQLSALWVNVERAMGVTIPPDLTIRKRMIWVAVGMFSCAFVEHVMSIASQIGINCPLSMMLQRYTLASHGFLLLKYYTIWLAVPLFFMSNIATILWNFQDVLVVLISMGLTSRYHRLNKYVAKLCASENKQRKNDFKMEPVKLYTWRKIREAYVKQAMLVRKVNEAVGPVIMLSCFGNFYFICLQLFLGITQGIYSDVLKELYYLVSLFWIIGRICCVVLAASHVNAHSKQALQYIYSCQFKFYNVEIERLQNQLLKDDVALTGMGFFSLNKSVLLQMAGAIVTYELVLIQFDNKGSIDADDDRFIMNVTGN